MLNSKKSEPTSSSRQNKLMMNQRPEKIVEIINEIRKKGKEKGTTNQVRGLALKKRR